MSPANFRPLHENWRLSATVGSAVPENVTTAAIPATVPGCVHTDLLAAGLIDDPYLDDNENRLAWIGRADWRYETAFEWDDDGSSHVDLVCAGLDTVATVTVNDVEVGRTANMHRSYRFDVRELLRPGTNRLAVRFDSAYSYAERLRDYLGDRPNAYPEPFNFIRKEACNFGWDWGPTLVTAGIWRPIGLHSWSGARLAQVRPQVTVEGGWGRVRLAVDLDNESAEPLSLVAQVAGVRTSQRIEPGVRTATLLVDVEDPELWWPRGHGAQALYELSLDVRDAEGRSLDQWSRHIGFRTVRVDTDPDEHGTPFTLEVNGRPILVRGANWIPDDVFITRVTRDRYAARLAQACDANINFLRVWGGGIYEQDDFYSLADTLGILVSQDFPFACAAYPEEEPIASEVEAEARENVVRLASHPSLVTWIGNNENIWGWHDWEWQPRLDGRTWGEKYYLDTLPKIVSELDPTRPYWPASPYSGDTGRHPNEPEHGTMHIWDVWNERDYTHYRDYVPRFLAEFGYQAPPAYATLRKAISDAELAPDSPGMAHHQKAENGDAKLQRGLDAHLPAPADFDDWHYLTQLNQARALSLGIEHFRSHFPVCMGTVMWQLNDCWPVTSWAAVDGDGRRKPLWYALRRVHADRVLTVQPRDGGLALVAGNDCGRDWNTPVTVTRYTVSGERLGSVAVEVSVAARDSSTVELPASVAVAGDPAGELLLAEGDGLRAWWFFAEDKDIAYPKAAYEAEVTAVAGGYAVRVAAGTILRDLCLFPDRLDPAATVDDALVTLLPGESAVFTVTSVARLDPVALASRPVLRCVNDLVGGA